jgi:hypothetical protein
LPLKADAATTTLQTPLEPALSSRHKSTKSNPVREVSSCRVGQFASECCKKKTPYTKEAKRVSKRTKTKETFEYKFSRFSLCDRHLTHLESSKTSKEAWLHGETIVAFLEIQKCKAYIFEDYETMWMFGNMEVKLDKEVNFYQLFYDSK